MTAANEPTQRRRLQRRQIGEAPEGVRQKLQRQTAPGPSATAPNAEGSITVVTAASTTDPNILTIPEAARLLRISNDLAYALARRGELPGALQFGRRWRVSRKRLLAAIHDA